MKIDRRNLLALLGVGAATPAAAQSIIPPGVDPTPKFAHGVASGDPMQDRVIIWTRLTHQADVGFDIDWEVARDAAFAQVVASGKAPVRHESAFTVKVDVKGLKPGTAYFYRFRWGDLVSPVGRTRTLPAGATKDAVIAVASCSLYPNGYFNAYQAIADLERVDVVLHLGDYFYEYGGDKSYGMDSPVASQRPHDPPHEVVTLADYRRRHAQYKTDPALQAAHARAPWILAWDDHETANDSYAGGAQNHQPAVEGDWSARKATALKAYYEWMPIREPGAGKTLAEAGARSFRIGDLAQIVMLETRLTARDRQLVYDRDLPEVDGKRDIEGFRKKLADPSRRMMGPAQEAWFAGELSGSVKAGHAWQVVGSGVVMGRLMMPLIGRDITAAEVAALPEDARKRVERWQAIAALGLPYGLDMWDGYPVDRERVYEMMTAAKARPIVVSGDSHAFWVNELSNAGGKRVAVEFGGTSITSPGADDVMGGFKIGPAFAKASPEVVHNDQGSKGFVLLTLSHTEALGDLVAVSTITDKAFTSRTVKSFKVKPDGTGVTGLMDA